MPLRKPRLAPPPPSPTLRARLAALFASLAPRRRARRRGVGSPQASKKPDVTASSE